MITPSHAELVFNPGDHLISKRFKEVVRIADHLIGVGHPVFIIAEAGVNHNGDLALAKQLIDVAATSGADAVKFQSFKADLLVTASAPKADYQLKTTASSESQLEMLKGLELKSDHYRDLRLYAALRRILFLSTPFDSESADELDEIGVPAFKISSGDLTNTPLLQHVARKGKPILVSTGMADLSEVNQAVTEISEAGADELILLHCVSNYPAAPGEVNLRAIRTLQETFCVPTGYSDHTEGLDIAFAAAAVGACVLEKHFTLDRSLPGPDHRASLEPDELSMLVQGVRRIEQSLGDGIKTPSESERQTALIARRSLIAACNITKGTEIEARMIVCKRPGTGLPPSRLPSILGRRSLVDIEAGTILSESMLEQ